ncbi:hypothetical protein [Nitrosomonas sp.]|nr:hypothetical protein [Nitrosomonas sp.]
MHPQLTRIVVTYALLLDAVVREEINFYVDLLKRSGSDKLAVIR